MLRICFVDGCEKIHYGKGLCHSHYRFWKKYGDPLKRADPEKRRKKQSDFMKKNNPMNNPYSRKKLSKTKTGVPRPDLVGKKHSEETKKKMSIAQKGKSKSQTHRKNLRKSILESYANGRINPRKGVSLPQEQKDRQSRKMKGKSSWNKGNKTPEKVKKKISESRMKGIQAGKILPSRKGKHHTPEANQKNRQSHLGKKMSEESKKKMSIAQNKPETLQKNRDRRSKQIFPAKDSKPELLVQEILKHNKIDFKKHKNFKLSKSNHQADIVIKSDKVIEVFGDYWHFNPKYYDGKSIQKVRRKKIKVKEVWKYDKYLIDGMKEQGYKVLIVWESELKNELEQTIQKILKFINS